MDNLFSLLTNPYNFVVSANYFLDYLNTKYKYIAIGGLAITLMMPFVTIYTIIVGFRLLKGKHWEKKERKRIEELRSDFMRKSDEVFRTGTDEQCQELLDTHPYKTVYTPPTYKPYECEKANFASRMKKLSELTLDTAQKIIAAFRNS